MRKIWGIILICAVLLFAVFLSDGQERKTTGEKTAPQTPPKVIRVVMDDNYPPYAFRDDSGRLQGILVDEWKLWEEKTGIKVELTGTDWENALVAMREGMYDVLDTAFYNEERAAWLDFARPYAKIEVPVFYHKNISGITDADSLRGFVVAVKAGDASIYFLRKRGIRDIVEFQSYEAIINAAAKGNVRVFVMDKPPALYYLYKKGIEDQFHFSPPLYAGEFHRAVKKGDRELLKLVEGGFSLISKAEYQKIEAKWFGAKIGWWQNPRYLRYGLYGLLCAAGVFALLFYWNYLLKREVKKKTIELFREKELLSTTLFSIGDGVVTTDNAGKITSLNNAAREISGWEPKEALGKPFGEVFRLINEQTGEAAEDPVAKVFEYGKVVGLANHTALIRKDGKEVPIADSAAPIRDEHGNVFGVVVVFRDVTHEKAQQEQIMYLSYHDPLTGLYNRRFAEEEMARLEAAGVLPVAVIVGDVNGLKLANDVFGHAQGDRLLQRAAEAIKKACGSEAVAARWGGDEFLVLLKGQDWKEAEAVLRKIRINCREAQQDNIRLSIALGYGIRDGMEKSFRETTKEAEEWMYRRKLMEGKSYRNHIISTLRATLFEKSMETEEHAQRLQNRCRMIARELGLSSREIDELLLFSALHDIGKVGIRESILMKPGPLTPEEWEEMKKHPEIGYRIAQNTPELAGVAEYILCHHERWDGHGYPRGLKGEEIPLLSRILAVADAYDAMTEDRVYRKALTQEEAMEEIRKNAGRQFDPKVVEAFFKACTIFTGADANSRHGAYTEKIEA